jgi:voltage-gated potassium channel
VSGVVGTDPERSRAESRRPVGRTALRRRQAWVSLLRSCLVIAVIFAAYAQAPLGEPPDLAVTLRIFVSFVVLVAVLVWQVWAINHSHYPMLRGIEAVAVSLPLFITMFAATYSVMAQMEPNSFNERLTRLDAMYFAVTVFATVGFGDIVPTSEVARAVVTIQMLADLVLIALVARVFVGLVRHRRKALDRVARDADGGSHQPTT